MTEETKVASNQWMIYGAYGYSGQLIAEEAVRRGLKPIVAGRDSDKVKALADRLGLEPRVFDLTETSAVKNSLRDVDLVIHCAGPFSATSAPMIDACIRSGTHYFDITGEISVFEHAHSPAVNYKAQEAGIVVCPGVGFDVIPTDCVAATLAEAMPDATHLTLAFAGGSALSPGTAKTSLEAMAEGGKIRRDGKIVSAGVKLRKVDLGRGLKQAMSIAWGDVSTAYHTTGIKNIEVYIPASNKTVRMVRLMQLLRPALRIEFVQNFLKQQLEKRIKGPNSAVRKKTRSTIWGEVKNTKGEVRYARLETPNGYDVTVLGPLAIVAHFVKSGFDATGSITPSRLMGKDFVSRLPGTTKIEVFRG